MHEQHTPQSSPPISFMKRRAIATLVDGLVDQVGDRIWTRTLDDLVEAVHRNWNADEAIPWRLGDDDLPVIRQRFQRAIQRRAVQA